MKEAKETQEPFSRVAPVLRTALLIGAGGGFLLAAILTITSALSIPLGAWWEAMAQAHGHLQLYGWAGLMVLGVSFHFFPRLRGSPLAGARFVTWLPVLLIASLLLRAISQPLLAVYPASAWGFGLIASGVVELMAFALVFSLLLLTVLKGPRPSSRPAYWGVLPLLAGAFCLFAIAGAINLANTIEAAQNAGLVGYTGDTLNVMLGLFGFLMPVALAMSARSLPMYAGLESFPRRVLWPLAFSYFTAILLLCIGVVGSPLPGQLSTLLEGLGMALLGAIVLLFVGIFLSLMRRRGHVPERVSKLAPSPEKLARSYQMQVRKERVNYGPFVGLVASAYMWAMFGAVLLLIDGIGLLTAGSEPVAFDAARHAFALGFIALLICGIAPRMLPSFSGGKIVSPRLVSATLWLGNAASILRVGAVLFAPLFAGAQGIAVDTLLFSLSGPLGLALAICLAINLWPALRSE